MEIEFQGGDDLQTNYPQAPVQGSFQCAFDPQEIPKLEINASYNSADELMAAVRHFQRTTGAKFYIRDCVTLGELWISMSLQFTIVALVLSSFQVPRNSGAR